MLKVLVVGSDNTFSIENFYVKYLKENSIDVSRFLAPNIFYDYYQKNIINKIAFKTGVSLIYKFLNSKFRETVEIEKPDIIWVFKGMELYPESLEWARSRNIKLVNYNPDNPFLFSGVGSGNKNITRSISLYHLHFTYNLEIKKKLEMEFDAKTFWLPFGFEVNDEMYNSLCEQEEILETCFLGNPDKERSLFIESLAYKGVSITVFGLNWERYTSHPNVKIAGPVYGSELSRVLRKYRVQLNLLRPHNLDSHNMRTFEVPGVGGIMVAPNTAEHQMFFQNGREAFWFKDLSECADLIKCILQFPEQKVEEIRKAARERSLQSGYSYEERSAQALREISKLMSR